MVNAFSNKLPTNQTSTAKVPVLKSLPHGSDLDPYLPDQAAMTAQTKGQNLSERYMPPEMLANKGALGFGSAGITQALSDPYNMPASIKTSYFKNANAAGQAGVNRMRMAGFASGQVGGGEGSGVSRAMMGNAEMARAEGMADAEAAYDDMVTKIGDARIAQMYLPLLQQYSEMYDASMGRALDPKTKQVKRDWLKTVGGALVATVGGYFTGGALTPVGMAIAESGAPHTETTTDY